MGLKIIAIIAIIFQFLNLFCPFYTIIAQKVIKVARYAGVKLIGKKV